MIYRKVGKRLLDLFLASLMFLILLPVFLFLLIVLSIHFNGKPFFIQKRPGKGNVIFQILKFKTMEDAMDEQGNPLADDQRISKIGSWVRRSSLDEIPQLINVLKGDMSLIGPRPLLPEYLALYSTSQLRRHEVKPGVTGWAQINGRNAISWTKKFELDIWYVDHFTFLLDLKILIITLWNVIRGKGVSQHGHVSVGKFTGKN